MFKKKFLFFYIWLLFSFILQQSTFSQCVSPINIFPYNEDFELTDGNWVPNNASHWEWGQIISKPVITAAGGGSKCWIVGGFSGSQYNSGSSYLQSPCFDISSLALPQISFKVFWETEKRYDGATLQYSLDGGTIWQTLGSINSNSDCSGQNWFNYNPINILGGPGWSGNIEPTTGSCLGGGGSGQWLTARHTLSSITGATSVIFRFTFAAGTTCNNFDGFAIDDININETPPNTGDFTYTCGANSITTFTSNINGCKSGLLWDFQDVASGSNNSTVDNPVHTFSSPGTYNVKLTINFITGPPLVVSKTITIIAVSTSLVNQVKCNGDHTGAITVNVNPAGTYNYNWDTNPVQVTPVINTLGAGTYTVTVTGTNTCSTSLPVTLTEPSLLNIRTFINDATCGANNGSITTTVTGGTSPYNFSWSNGESTPAINNLSANTYSMLLLDANGCAINTVNLQVKNNNNPINVFLGNDTTICPGDKLILNPGNFSSYKWQDNSIASTFTVTSTGNYSVFVTDIMGCTGSGSVKVTVDCSEIFFPSAFTPNADGVNDGFGPLPVSSLSSLSSYKLTVYGRWGEVIFTTSDPFMKWDGTYKGKTLNTGVFTWIASYIQKNYLPIFQKGTVSLIH